MSKTSNFIIFFKEIDYIYKNLKIIDKWVGWSRGVCARMRKNKNLYFSKK